MTVTLAAAAGFLTGRLVWLLARPTFTGTATFQRENYRGHRLPTAVGLVVPWAALVVEAGRAAAGSLGVGSATAITSDRVTALIACVGFALLGLVDDLAGDGDRRGFRGHLSAMAAGQLTTGGVKLVGGFALGLVVVAPRSGPGALQLLADAALVALAANTANLLDRAPGRTGKVVLVAFVVLAVVTSAAPELTGVAVAVGAGAALLLDDLRERLMLGDTGANALGAVLGVGLVLTTVPSVRLAVLVGLIALNVVSEIVSFSRVIDAVPPLRGLDRAGRRRP